LLERTEFDHLCDEVSGVSNSDALLGFLHHNGAVFYRPGLFGNRIVLDQNWALEAIYALFDRKKILPLLRGYGRFSRADLEALVWSGYTPEEQEVFSRDDGELRHLLSSSRTAAPGAIGMVPRSTRVAERRTGRDRRGVRAQR
jgi:hypothetical protein